MAFDVVTYALCKANDGQIWEYVKSMEKLTIVVADEVPTVETAEPNKLYLVDTNHDGVYEEYVLAEVGGEPEILELGNITDLSNYYTKSEADALFDDKENYIEVLSQADYNQLTPAQIAEDRAYMVIIDNTHGEFYKQGRLYGTTTAPHILYDNTTSGLTATNVQDAIDEVYGSITVPDADDISYDNTSSGISATNVQDAIDEVYSSVTVPDADDVSYDNTSSGMSATNVQDAIDEVATAVTNIDAGDVTYDNTTSGTTATNVQDALDELAASAGATHVDLTQAEYNQLTPAEQNDGTEYFITDAQVNMDYSSLENRILKMEGNFINVSPNLQMLNPAAYKQVTKVSDNEVYFIVTDPITHIDYKVTVTATGTGDTRTNPQYTIQQVVGQ